MGARTRAWGLELGRGGLELGDGARTRVMGLELG